MEPITGFNSLNSFIEEKTKKKCSGKGLLLRILP